MSVFHIRCPFSYLLHRYRYFGKTTTQFADRHSVVVKALNTTLRGVLLFFAEALKKNLSPDAVVSDIESLGLAKEKAALVGEAWKSAFAGLSVAMMRKTLTVNMSTCEAS